MCTVARSYSISQRNREVTTVNLSVTAMGMKVFDERRQACEV